MATRTLYLVRHGAYHHVEIDSSDGYRLMTRAREYDGGLTDDGKRQAAIRLIVSVTWISPLFTAVRCRPRLKQLVLSPRNCPLFRSRPRAHCRRRFPVYHPDSRTMLLISIQMISHSVPPTRRARNRQARPHRVSRQPNSLFRLLGIGC
jgi:hypothetical protein